MSYETRKGKVMHCYNARNNGAMCGLKLENVWRITGNVTETTCKQCLRMMGVK